MTSLLLLHGLLRGCTCRRDGYRVHTLTDLQSALTTQRSSHSPPARGCAACGLTLGSASRSLRCRPCTRRVGSRGRAAEPHAAGCASANCVYAWTAKHLGVSHVHVMHCMRISSFGVAKVKSEGTYPGRGRECGRDTRRPLSVAGGAGPGGRMLA